MHELLPTRQALKLQLDQVKNDELIKDKFQAYKVLEGLRFRL